MNNGSKIPVNEIKIVITYLNWLFIVGRSLACISVSSVQLVKAQREKKCEAK